jgi:aminoglycoside phosphotransferase (APT) family kinase protein
MTESPSGALAWRREVSDITQDLARWVSHELGPGAALGECTMPDNGMANETLVFNVGSNRYVARLAPHKDTPYPVFPVFDLRLQRDCMELVRTRTKVPVPEVVQYEHDPQWLGTPFLVMDYVEGEVPRDTPPYLLEGWMTALSATDLTRLEKSTVEVLVGIHQVRAEADLALFGYDRPDPSPLGRQLTAQGEYYQWAREGRRVPAIEEALSALGTTVPHNDRTVLNWGDSRIGNIIYQDCRPVAVLDWEMATTGPPEVDVAWMVFLHTFMLEMITTFMPDTGSGGGVDRMAEFLRRDRVVNLYERAAGERLDDLTWYEAFAGVRFAIILMRMSLRAAASGAMALPGDPDALIMFAPLLRRLVSNITS